MPAITMDILNELGDIEAKGVCISDNKFLSFGKNKTETWKEFNVYTNLSNPLKFIYNLILAEYWLIKRILWCDIIIWQWDVKVYLPHYWLMKLLKKPLLVEWVGSDIRIPDFIFPYSPFYKMEFDNKNYTYTNESRKRSFDIQKKFKSLNAIPMLCPEMSLFLDRTMFPEYIPMYQRINLQPFSVSYPSVGNTRPIIVHTPSATGGKGTRFVRNAIDRLKSTLDFEYLEIVNKTHKEALETIAKADIFLDQFLAGAYGMASCEAMAMGKPVFCFLLKPLKELLPEDCPIVNVDIDSLEFTLKEYILNATLRNQTGIKSRQYVESYHDANKVCRDLNAKLLEIINSKHESV
jgi:hypothetical protein